MDTGKANNSENSDSDASTSDDDVQSNDMVSSIICMWYSHCYTWNSLFVPFENFPLYGTGFTIETNSYCYMYNI